MLHKSTFLSKKVTSFCTIQKGYFVLNYPKRLLRFVLSKKVLCFELSKKVTSFCTIQKGTLLWSIQKGYFILNYPKRYFVLNYPKKVTLFLTIQKGYFVFNYPKRLLCFVLSKKVILFWTILKRLLCFELQINIITVYQFPLLCALLYVSVGYILREAKHAQTHELYVKYIMLTSRFFNLAICNDRSCIGMMQRIPCKQSIVCGTLIDVFPIACVSISSLLLMRIGSPYNVKVQGHIKAFRKYHDAPKLSIGML